jgi:hypothetical protein
MRLLYRLQRWLLAQLVSLSAAAVTGAGCWNIGASIMNRLAAMAALHRQSEAWICHLGPKAALVFLFVLPASCCSVKLLALGDVAHGHPVLGLTVIVLAKLGGAAAIGCIC